MFNTPTGIALDSAGTVALVADKLNHYVRRIVISTGSVSTLAGMGMSGMSNGIGTNSMFNNPTGLGVALDSAGAVALVADQLNHNVRLIVLASGLVSTLAGMSMSGQSLLHS